MNDKEAAPTVEEWDGEKPYSERYQRFSKAMREVTRSDSGSIAAEERCRDAFLTLEVAYTTLRAKLSEWEEREAATDETCTECGKRPMLVTCTKCDAVLCEVCAAPHRGRHGYDENRKP